jgi:hypothetical protein
MWTWQKKRYTVVENYVIRSFVICTIQLIFFYLSIYLSVCLSLLLSLGAWGIRETLVSLQFLNLRQSVGLLGLGISPSQGRYLHTNRINADKHPYIEWDSNPRPQYSSRRLWSVISFIRVITWLSNWLFYTTSTDMKAAKNLLGRKKLSFIIACIA